MKEYHKIQTVFKRDPETKFKTLLMSEYSTPEFEYLANNEWVWTEKVDGTNIRVMWDGEGVTFGGKTDNAQIPAHLVTVLYDEFTPTKMLEQFGTEGGVCLYGEGYGMKIQKPGARYISDNSSFILFDCRVGTWWLDRVGLEDVAVNIGIDIVPIIGMGSLHDAVRFCKDGYRSTISEDATLDAEGLVLKPLMELTTRSGGRIISKIKHKDFQT